MAPSVQCRPGLALSVIVDLSPPDRRGWVDGTTRQNNKGSRAEIAVPKIPRQLTDAQIPAGIEYIKAQLEYARDDSRQVYLRVTAALAVAGLVLTQLPFVRLKALEVVPKVVLAVGICALLVAAVFHHLYLTRIHHRARPARYRPVGGFARP